MRLTTKDLIEVSIFTALMAIGAYINIGFPTIPFTMQTLFVLLAGLLLGPVKGSISMLIYLFLGIIGVPVFAVPPFGGFSYIYNITFGYLIGFIFASYITGYIANKLKNNNHNNMFIKFIYACLAGYVVYTLFGVTYAFLIKNLYFNTSMSISVLFKLFVLPYIIFDFIKCLGSSYLAFLIIPRLKKALGRS